MRHSYDSFAGDKSQLLLNPFQYLLINVLVLACLLLVYPLSAQAIRWHWKEALASVAISGAAFLALTDFMMNFQVIDFNERFVLGFYLGEFPIEVCLLFATIPLLWLQLYALLKHRFQRGIGIHHGLSWFIIVSSLFLGYYFYPRLVTSFGMFLAAALFSLQLFFFRSAWMRHFFPVVLAGVPLYIVLSLWFGGVLTNEPLLAINATETIGITIWSLPIEGIVFGLAYLLLLVATYERSLFRKHGSNMPNRQDDYI